MQSDRYEKCKSDSCVTKWRLPLTSIDPPKVKFVESYGVAWQKQSRGAAER